MQYDSILIICPKNSTYKLAGGENVWIQIYDNHNFYANLHLYKAKELYYI